MTAYEKRVFLLHGAIFSTKVKIAVNLASAARLLSKLSTANFILRAIFWGISQTKV